MVTNNAELLAQFPATASPQLTGKAGLLWQTVETAWGYLALIANRQQRPQLAGLVLPTDSKTELRRQVETAWPEAQVTQESLFAPLEREIQDYFLGRGQGEFHALLELRGYSPFRQRVIAECRNIRAGMQITYGQLAAAVGAPRAARAVGRVMAANPIPLIIPCHRVVGKNNKMVGFSGAGGTEMKKRLLNHEQKAFGNMHDCVNS